MRHTFGRLRSRRAALAGAAAAFAGLGVVRGRTRAAQFSWKYGSVNSADEQSNVAALRAFQRIRAESNGAIEITAFFSASLGNASAMISQVRLGALEMLSMNGGTLDTVVPVASIEGMAYAFHDRRTIFRAMDGDLGELIRGEFASHGFVALDRVWENGYRHITTNSRPIHRAQDLQGLKLRVGIGRLFADTFHSLDVETVSMDSPQAYVALQTHLADGQEGTLPTTEELRFYEVQKYCSLSHHMWAGKWLIINREKWESLPRDLQAVVRKHANAAGLAERDATEAVQVSTIEKLRGQGMLVNDVDVQSFRVKLSANGYYARWRKEYGPKAWAALEKYSGPLG